MRIEEEIEEFRSRIEKYLKEEIRDPVLGYAVFPAGKMIRPLLVFAGAYPLRFLPVLQASAAVELVHDASLVHDDLPCVDNDKTRRGKPAVHVKFGEGAAIMIGDALLSLAFDYASRLDCKAVRLLSRAAGMDGISGGQILDLQGASSVDEIREVHLKKTARLMETSFLLGLLVSERESLMDRGSLLGREIGLLFQIVDDILDRETCGDEPNVVKILGMDRALALAEEHYSKVLEMSEEFPGREIIRWLAKKTIEKAFSRG